MGRQDVFMSKVSGNIVARGFAWKLGEQFGVQLVKFIIQIVLARLLLPEEYGLIAIIAVFIQVSDIIAQAGLNTALVQKKEVDRLDYSTIVWSSLLLAAVMYVILFVAAPWIAGYYGEALLKPVLRILAVSIFFVAFNAIQVAHVSRQMNFRVIFVTNTVSNVLAGCIGIVMALKGAGVWALVAQQILSYVFQVVIMLFRVRMQFSFEFSFSRFWKLFDFGVKVMLASIVAAVTENLYNLVLGKIYNSAMTGYYSRGQQFPKVICTSVNASIASVLLPVMSKAQDDLREVKRFTRASISLSTYVVLPIMAGMMAVAEPLVRVLLTDKWLMCVPFLRLECLFYATLPMMYTAGQACKAVGKPGISLKMEIIKSALTLVVILSLARVVPVLWIVAFRAVISLVVVMIQNVYVNKILKYPGKEWAADVLPALLLSGVMGCVVYTVSFLAVRPITLLAIQILVGAGIYLLGSIVTKNRNFKMLIQLLSQIKGKA